jgi:para-nitrobenzyl esterase
VNSTRIILIFALLSTSSEIATAGESIVITERGPVRGTVTPTFREFLGIPYAAPPIGNLRWKLPKDHARWFAPLDATRFGNHCPQVASIFGVASVTEDCLFLNIFAPNGEAEEEKKSRSLPVMVWIHGGALTVGESDDYIPTELVQQKVM